jgi:hypothetical protein
LDADLVESDVFFEEAACHLQVTGQPA